MEVKGKLIEISPVINVTDSFKKREFVLEIIENPKYPEFVKFEVVQDKVGLLDQIRVGANVAISFNLRGRAWTNKQGKQDYYNSLQAWKVTSENEQKQVQSVQEADTDEDESDLPF